MSNRADHLFRQALEQPDKVALVFGEREIGFREWRDRARALADGLVRQGLGPGDKVALLVGSRPEFLFLQYACYTAGGVVLPLNIRRGSESAVFGLHKARGNRRPVRVGLRLAGRVLCGRRSASPGQAR